MLKSFLIVFALPVVHGITASTCELTVYILNYTRNTNSVIPWAPSVVNHYVDYVPVVFFLSLCSSAVVSKWVCCAVVPIWSITLCTLTLLRFFFSVGSAL